MSNKKLENFDLPPMPQVVSKIIQIDENNIEVSSDELQALIAVDPALTSKILKIANSAFYARANRISSLSQAITLLGFKTIKSLTLLVSTAGLFPKQRRNVKIQKELWMRSVLTALVSKLLAEMISKRGLRDEAFMAGLLKNIGQLILLAEDQPKYEDAFQRTRYGLRFSELREFERKYFSVTGPEVSVYAMKKWNFPEEFITAAEPETPREGMDAAENDIMKAIVITAEVIVLKEKMTDLADPEEHDEKELNSLFDSYANILEMADEKRKYIEENFQKMITNDSFYSFCEELFGM